MEPRLVASSVLLLLLLSAPPVQLIESPTKLITRFLVSHRRSTGTGRARIAISYYIASAVIGRVVLLARLVSWCCAGDNRETVVAGSAFQ